MDAASPVAPVERKPVLLSVVVPLFNEQAIVPQLCERLFAALPKLG